VGEVVVEEELHVEKQFLHMVMEPSEQLEEEGLEKEVEVQE
jgi:hypothetical protein